MVIHGHDLGRKYDLGAEALTIGRSRDNDICIDEKGVSRKHCELGIEKRGAYLRDLRSTNGTFVNDQSNPIQSTYLNDGDRIRIGRTIFKYVSGANIEAAYHEQLLRLSTTDGLTQVFNRRYFDETLDRELRRARRYDRPLALLLFDIDHLRPCNDTHGHRAGDFVLRKVAELATLRARKVDIVARHGGEEFAILCPELVDPDASVFAERLRTAVQEHEFEFEGQRIPVTISIGLAIATPPHPQGYDLLAAADQCLHQAKANGRNQVVVEQLAPAVAAERADVEVSVTIAVPRAQISGPSLDVAFPLLSRLAAAFGAAAVDQFRTGAHA
ncbi:MAG TPA: GGDEF domain-containing protein, partial [Enhygromyxa sp.]|nr:GGDEF domain-containing protein [Enhygromyxa sp.]